MRIVGARWTAAIFDVEPPTLLELAAGASVPSVLLWAPEIDARGMEGATLDGHGVSEACGDGRGWSAQGSRSRGRPARASPSIFALNGEGEGALVWNIEIEQASRGLGVAVTPVLDGRCDTNKTNTKDENLDGDCPPESRHVIWPGVCVRPEGYRRSNYYEVDPRKENENGRGQGV